MARSDKWRQCKIEAADNVKQKAKVEGSVQKALKAVSSESGIPVGTLKRWVYPNGQKTYERKRSKRRAVSANDTALKPDGRQFTATLDGFNYWLKETGRCLLFAHRIIRGKVPQETPEERKVVIDCFKLINAFCKKHVRKKVD